MKTRSLFGILCVSIATLTAHSSIVYVNGPSFQAGGYREWNPRGVDFDHDGTNEFTFWASGMICTADVPTSGCSWPFYTWTAGTNEVLLNDFFVSPLSLGETVGAESASGSWVAPVGFYGAGVTFWWYSRSGREIDGQWLHSGWLAGVGDVGAGYLGVRFFASDGLHYGWIRVRLPQSGFFVQPQSETTSVSPTASGPTPIPLELVPVVVDWAYETHPNTPIRAGDIGSDSDSAQFKVEFFETSRKRNRTNRVSGNGSIILTDSKLRCELHLAGDFSSAEIQGPANPRSHGKANPVWNFPPPLVHGTNHTAFFGEAPLTRAQLLQLAHGQLFISVDDCDLVGRITPVEHDRKRKR